MPVSDTLGWLKGVPPEMGVDSAVAKESIAPDASARAEMRAELSCSRRSSSASFGARAASERVWISSWVSRPEPMPRLYPIEVTMGSPSVMIIDGRRAAFFRPSTGQGSDRPAGQVGVRAERSAGLLGDRFGGGQHMIQGDVIAGWVGCPGVLGHTLQQLLQQPPPKLCTI